MEMSQEPFHAVIYRKDAGPVRRARPEHLDWTPALNCDRKNPFSVATLLGEQKAMENHNL